MSRSDDLRVADIVEAAQHLVELVELVAGGRDVADADWTRQRAAERLLEIIGEASNALSEGFKAKHPAVLGTLQRIAREPATPGGSGDRPRSARSVTWGLWSGGMRSASRDSGIRVTLG